MSSPSAGAASSPSTYTPQWKGPIEGYVVNFATRHLWKVQATMERADVLQEAYLVYMRCADKYPAMDTPQHFMSLFKTSWSRRFTDLANADTRRRAMMHPLTSGRDNDGEEMQIQEPVGDLDNAGVVATLIRQAPAEVKLVLQLLISCSQELLDMALGSSWQADGRDGSARINRLVGLPEGYDSVREVRAYFSR